MKKSKEYLENQKYLEEVYRVRTFVINRLHRYGFRFVENKRLVPTPNWHNRIKSNGAIGLICWKNGLPMSLMTPWGEIRFVDIDTDIGFGQNISEKAIERFMSEIKEMFGLQQMFPGQDIHGFNCPTYSITRFPWNNEFRSHIEMKNRTLNDDEKFLFHTCSEGKQLCLDIFGRETAV